MCDAQPDEGERRLILVNIKSKRAILTLEQMEERRLIETIEITRELQEIIATALRNREIK